ncbi:oxidoreductase [Gammaproteobacteria bacterium 42_54_T18]|nr:oxidoreductase [Gammaproteobacteria bacterium 42_54_T18]
MLEEKTRVKSIRWGIIGCGVVTEVKSGPAYQKVAGFELTSVMRRNIDAAANYAQRHGIAHFSDNADEIINSSQIDAIYIATPPDSHKYYALKVALAGKPCCVEKPLAPSYADCVEINEAFASNNTPLFVAYYRRSLPRFNQVKRWLSDGVIGEVRHVCWNLSKPANQIDLSGAKNWRTEAAVASAGYFDDLACHGLDLFAYLLGDICEAKGITANQQGLYSANDAVSASWLHKSGVTGSGSWNFGCFEREDRVEIFGDQGKLTFSIFDERPVVLKSRDDDQALDIPHPENIQLCHVENMREHLLGRLVHPSTGESATNTGWVMDQILGRGVL